MNVVGVMEYAAGLVPDSSFMPGGSLGTSHAASALREAGAAVADLLALRDRVARLNPAAGEIGAGMLASLVAEARRLGGAP